MFFYHRPQRPGRPPLAPPLGAPRGLASLTVPCWPPLAVWLPRPPRCWPQGWVFPRWLAGSWPDSHSGGGTGLGVGGLCRREGSGLHWNHRLQRPALEVRWTPSPAQMLVPSTVVRSCKGDSRGPKNSRIFKILASELKGLDHEILLIQKVWKKWTDLDLNKGRERFPKFPKAPPILYKKKIEFLCKKCLCN